MRQTALTNDREESERNEAAQPFRSLADYLDGRPELGFGRMVVNLALEPRNPFKPQERRKAKKGFVMTVFFVMAFIAWFAWFNFVR